MTILTHVKFGPSRHTWMADQLLTTENPLMNKDWLKPIDLPTHHNANLPLAHASDVVVGLTQKISIIDDNLLVGWAGSCDDAISAVKQICDARKNGEITDSAAFIDFLARMKANNSFTLFSAFMDNKILTTFVNGPQARCTIGDLDAEAVGTGKDDLLPALLALHKSPGGKPNSPYQEFICGCLSVVTTLMGEQIRTSRGLSACYGGGFEIAALISGRFQKIEATYLFLDVARTSDSRYTITFHKILKFGYVNDWLIIRTCDCNAEACNNPRDNHEFIVGPVHHLSNDYLLEAEALKDSAPDWNSQFTCIYVYYSHSGRSDVLIHYSRNQAPAVKFVHDGNCLDFELSLECVQRIEKWL